MAPLAVVPGQDSDSGSDAGDPRSTSLVAMIRRKSSRGRKTGKDGISEKKVVGFGSGRGGSFNRSKKGCEDTPSPPPPPPEEDGSKSFVRSKINMLRKLQSANFVEEVPERRASLREQALRHATTTNEEEYDRFQLQLAQAKLTAAPAAAAADSQVFNDAEVAEIQSMMLKLGKNGKLAVGCVGVGGLGDGGGTEVGSFSNVGSADGGAAATSVLARADAAPASASPRPSIRRSSIGGGAKPPPSVASRRGSMSAQELAMQLDQISGGVGGAASGACGACGACGAGGGPPHASKLQPSPPSQPRTAGMHVATCGTAPAPPQHGRRRGSASLEMMGGGGSADESSPASTSVSPAIASSRRDHRSILDGNVLAHAINGGGGATASAGVGGHEPSPPAPRVRRASWHSSNPDDLGGGLGGGGGTPRLSPRPSPTTAAMWRESSGPASASASNSASTSVGASPTSAASRSPVGPAKRSPVPHRSPRHSREVDLSRVDEATDDSSAAPWAATTASATSTSRTPPSRLPRSSREMGEIVHDPTLLASMQRREQRRERELLGDHSDAAAPSAAAASAAAALGGGGGALLPRIGGGAATAHGGADTSPVHAALHARQRRASHTGVACGALWHSPMTGGAAAGEAPPRADIDALLQAAEERLKQAAAEQKEKEAEGATPLSSASPR